MSPADASVFRMWLHGRSPNTADAYRRDVEQFLSFVGRVLASIVLKDLQAWADELTRNGLAPTTQARKLTAVRSLLTFAHDQGHISSNPGRRLKLPKGKDQLAQRILSEGELTRLIYLEENTRNRFILKLLYKAALRVSELVSLRWRDVQAHSEDRGQLTVFGKGGKTGHVVVEGEVWRELEARRGDPDERLVPLSRQQVWRIVQTATKKAGIRKAVSPHWMRHAHVSHALDRGAPAHLVRDTARHSSLAITSRYAHVKPNESSGKYLPL